MTWVTLQALWPRRGWSRALRYSWLRLIRTEGSPHTIAIGVAAGIFVSFLPVLGVQMTVAAALSYLMRGHVLSAVAGTFVGTPMTYPLMWLGSYRLGAWLLGYDASAMKQGAENVWSLLASSSDRVASQFAQQTADVLAPIFKPLLIGSVILGLAAGLAAYYTLVRVIGRLQTNRRAHLLARLA